MAGTPKSANGAGSKELHLLLILVKEISFEFLFKTILDKPFARLESDRLFDTSGRLIPSSTILGKNTFLADELVVRNSIVMPAKKLNYNISNQIVL